MTKKNILLRSEYCWWFYHYVIADMFCIIFSVFLDIKKKDFSLFFVHYTPEVVECINQNNVATKSANKEWLVFFWTIIQSFASDS